jgi:GNAT superfamily N-acetyltransferase
MIHNPQYMTTVIPAQPIIRHAQGARDGMTPGTSPLRPLPAQVRLASAGPADTAAVLDMLARCSRSTLFHRFHGFTDGLAYARALLRRPADQETLLAWRGSSCVGLATLYAEAAGRSDLGVLVEDAWQRGGIGSRLVSALIACAHTRRISTVHADVLGEDMFIVRALARIGPLTVSVDRGSYSVDVDLSPRR